MELRAGPYGAGRAGRAGRVWRVWRVGWAAHPRPEAITPS